MAKSISVPDTVYDDLTSVAEELTSMAKKPVSLSMAVYLLIAVYRAHLSEPCARDAFRQRLANSDIMSPEEFEKFCEKDQDKAPSKRNQRRNK